MIRDFLDLLGFFRLRWRIVTRNGASYQVEVWRWWLPIWCDIGSSDVSVEQAEQTIRRLTAKTRVVKYVGEGNG